MADETKAPTQGERLSTAEAELASLQEWAESVQSELDSLQATVTGNAGAVDSLGETVRGNAQAIADQVNELDGALRVLLDEKFGKNVRPAHLFHHTTRIDDPDDADVVTARRAAESGEPAVESGTDRLAALEAKLDAALRALAEKG